ncbi:fibrinogen C domain-containing protein 1-like [Diabrotica virgifera virgifera]|uniref:Fibrinogen C-terminal domain-containing protein n=1 Tax=Diabrotica virgifera virgifera TaxID=50390 RepID=A0ABM5KS30_DIAVI|nr:fibrinogen C domain-containing protein 1-like [Diabrotica virgifera virgifera]
MYWNEGASTLRSKCNKYYLSVQVVLVWECEMKESDAFDRNELLIELTDTDKNISYAQYSTFSIGCEKDGYPLKELTGYSGNAGDSLTSHINAKFTTLDVDQDKDPGNCAQKYGKCIFVLTK